MSKNKINVISFPDIKQAGRRNPKEAVVTRNASLEASEALKIWAKGIILILPDVRLTSEIRKF